MATLRQLMEITTDEVLLEEAYHEWVKKPGMLAQVAELEARLEQNSNLSHYSSARAQWALLVSTTNGLWRPETLYHVGRSVNWDVNRFPVPVKAASKYVALFARLVEQKELLHRVEFRFLPARHVRYLLDYEGDLTEPTQFTTQMKPLLEELCFNIHMSVTDVAQFMADRDLSLPVLANRPPLSRVVKEYLYQQVETVEDRHTKTSLLTALAKSVQKDVDRQKSFVVEEFRQILSFADPEDHSLALLIASDLRCPEEMVVEMMDSGLLRFPPSREFSKATLEAFAKVPDRFAAAAYRQPNAAHLLEDVVHGQKVLAADVVKSLGENPLAPEKVLVWLSKHRLARVRASAAAHPLVSVDLAGILAKDKTATVRRKVAKNENVPPGIRLFAAPTERMAGQLWETHREEFLDWTEATYPDLAGLPVNFLIPTVVSLVAQEVEPCLPAGSEGEDD